MMTPDLLYVGALESTRPSSLLSKQDCLTRKQRDGMAKKRGVRCNEVHCETWGYMMRVPGELGPRVPDRRVALEGNTSVRYE